MYHGLRGGWTPLVTDSKIMGFWDFLLHISHIPEAFVLHHSVLNKTVGGK